MTTLTYDTAPRTNLESAITLYLEQEHNYQLWLAEQEIDDALDAITTDAA